MDSNSANLCRLCLQTSDDDLVNIWEKYHDCTIASILEKHFWFQIDKNDGLTDWLCHICWIQTKTFHEFYENVKKFQTAYWDAVEKDHRTEDVTLEPDLNIVKCEETELTLQSIDSQMNSLDTNDDETDTDDGNKKSKNDKIGENRRHLNRKKTIVSIPSKRAERDALFRENFPMECDMCSDVKFETFLGYRQHYRKVHQISGYLTCCGKKFEKSVTLFEHMNLHKKAQTGPSSTASKRLAQDILIRQFFTMKCEICIDAVVFESFMGAKHHYRSVHQISGYLTCCGVKFEKSIRAFEHAIVHKNEQTGHVPPPTKKEERNALFRQYLTMKCEICADDVVEFETFLEAKHHFHKVHKIDGYLRCCGAKFLTPGVAMEHIRSVHINPGELTCDQCNKTFKSKYSLHNHIKNHHMPLESRAYKCSMCPKSFSVASTLTTHVKIKHTSKPGEKFPCDECGKNFLSNFSLYCHIRAVHKTPFGKHVCEICARQFKMKASLRYHMDTEHTTQPKVQCDICGSWLKNKVILVRHLKQHRQPDDDAKPVQCTVCDKSFRHKQALGSHVSYHHNGQSHVCRFCQKTLKSAKSLKAHLAGHTGDDLYSCLYCEKKFRSLGNMYSHRKKMHFTEWSRDFPELLHKAKLKRRN